MVLTSAEQVDVVGEVIGELVGPVAAEERDKRAVLGNEVSGLEPRIFVVASQLKLDVDLAASLEPGRVEIGSVDELGQEVGGVLPRVENEVSGASGVDELDRVARPEDDLESEGEGGEVKRVEIDLKEDALSDVRATRRLKKEVDVLNPPDFEGVLGLEDEVVVVPVERLNPLILGVEDLERHELAGASDVKDVPVGCPLVFGLDLRDDVAFVESGVASVVDEGSDVSLVDIAELALDEGIAHISNIDHVDVGGVEGLDKHEML